MFNRIRTLARAVIGNAAATERNLANQLLLLGLLHVDRIRRLECITDLSQVEFGVHSQFGEDGIIEYLVSHIPIESETFIEFGVENYIESNTRFLLRHRNWRGFVMDGSQENIEYIRRDPISWRHDLDSHARFITAENINENLTRAKFSGDIGLLSIDLDGVDYWVWKAIDVVTPRIVVCEYNSVFGSRSAITVPYDPNFTRAEAHYSKLFWGASLEALKFLARSKGYVFVGSNTAGVNAFFVREDLVQHVSPLIPNARHQVSQLRSSRDRDGRPTFLAGNARAQEIKDCIVYEVGSNQLVRFGDLE